MKRSVLARRSPLKRTRRKPVIDKAARAAWFDGAGSACQVCGRVGVGLERHHIISRQRIRLEGREDLLWDQRNALDLCARCHEGHTNASRRIPRSAIRHVPGLMAFAVELLGSEDRAVVLLAREYPTVIGA